MDLLYSDYHGEIANESSAFLFDEILCTFFFFPLDYFGPHPYFRLLLSTTLFSELTETFPLSEAPTLSSK